MTEGRRKRHNGRGLRSQQPTLEILDFIAANPLATPDEIPSTPIERGVDLQVLRTNLDSTSEVVLTDFMTRIMKMPPVIDIQPDKKKAYSEFALKINMFNFYRAQTDSTIVPVIHVVQAATESGRQAYQRMLGQFLNKNTNVAINPHIWRIGKGVITLNESLDDPALRRSFMGQFEQIVNYRQRVGDRKGFSI